MNDTSRVVKRPSKTLTYPYPKSRYYRVNKCGCIWKNTNGYIRYCASYPKCEET